MNKPIKATYIDNIHILTWISKPQKCGTNRKFAVPMAVVELLKDDVPYEISIYPLK